MESLVDKLNHAAHVTPTAWFFLKILRHLIKGDNKWVPQRLLYWHRQDIKLYMELIQWITAN